MSVDERTFKDSICISSLEMSLLPEPVLRLPHQLRILAKPVLLILAAHCFIPCGLKPCSPWFYSACLMNFESFDMLAQIWLSNRSIERIKFIAKLIINLLPRRLSLKDLIFI